MSMHGRFTRGLKHKPKRLPLSFWGWLIPVYKTTEEDLLKIAGFDAAVYMRIISFGERSLRCQHTVINCHQDEGDHQRLRFNYMQALNSSSTSPFFAVR